MDNEKDKFILPKVMTEIRQALKLTKVQLSQKADISRQSLTYYESGKTFPTLESTGKWLNTVTKEIRKLRRKAARLDRQQNAELK
jgi:DNA-binding XRE family transcriptional regulator